MKEKKSYENYLHTSTRIVGAESSIVHQMYLRYGIIPTEFLEASENLHEYVNVKGFSVVPLIDLTNKITGLWFYDIENKKEIFEGSGFLVFNKSKITQGTILLTDDKYAAFKIAATNYAVFLVKKIDKDLVSKIKFKYPNLYIVAPCHQTSDLKNRLSDLKIRILGLSEPVNTFSEPNELQEEIDALILKDAIKQWATPKGIKANMFDVKPLMSSMLPSILWNYAYDEALRADNMSIDFVAVCTLVSLSSVIGAKVAVKPKQKDDWTVIPNLWGGIVAPPSSKKTPAFNAGIRPVDRLNEIAKKDFIRQTQEYGVRKILVDSKDKALTDALKQANKKEDQIKVEQIANELLELRNVSEQPPILKRYKTNDASPEALGELERTNPNGILVCRDELVGLLSTMDSGKDEGGRSYYLEGWDGKGSYELDRIGRGSIFIENHCISILGGIQPTKLIEYLEPSIKGNGNDGLIQRFQLLVYPDMPEWKYKDEHPNKDARDALYSLFEVIDKLTIEDFIKMGAFPNDELNSIPYFRFSSEAQEKFIEWCTYLHKQVIPQEEYPIIIEHLDKYGKLLPALALIFHLIDCIQQDITGPITKKSIEMAIEWCTYLESHARRVYGLVLQGSSLKAIALGQKLLKLKKDHEWRRNGFAGREVQRKNWKDLTCLDSVSDALDILVEKEWLTVEEIESTIRGGRPSKRYWINPKIFETDYLIDDKTDIT
ncbi:hypothetical protein C3420_16550 [Acinetobacter sp. ACNIH3]|uniref:YfjI family protein n=1 Tax=unclassified Acinetobacter TaxID=196816 RepID=UPI000CDE409C|nr:MULTISPECIES: YfjI family protein [unclassified Acinetobacter]POU13046.1 hypothetical protein C3420_16550 [Acinetobacter sp. ACNIH3]POV72433.1 hypothetical protein C3421_16465 [Acinetobacter sp. ACNIH4]